MSRILASIVIVALCFTLGYSLECCLGSQCSDITTCSTGQQCSSVPVKKSEKFGLIPVSIYGCMAEEDCNKTGNFTISNNTINYQINSTCCNTNRCNTAAPLANTHTLTLTLAIASLASLLLTKALV